MWQIIAINFTKKITIKFILLTNHFNLLT